MADFLTNAHYLWPALICGPVLAAACALLSVFVVLRGMAMISEGIAHAGVGGLGVALLVGLFLPFLDNSGGQIVITGLFCVGTALLIGFISHEKHVSEDSAIGIFLVASVAVGICALTARRAAHGTGNVPPSLEDALFGAITTASPADVYPSLIIAAGVFIVIFSMYRAFVYTALDEEMARINGVPVKLINTLLLVMVSLVIVMTVRLVGLLMVSALMIIPGATARLISQSFGRVITASLVIGVGGMIGSLVLALLMSLNPVLAHIPSGPIIVLTFFSIFMTVWLFRKLFKRKAQPIAAAD